MNNDSLMPDIALLLFYLGIIAAVVTFTDGKWLYKRYNNFRQSAAKPAEDDSATPPCPDEVHDSVRTGCRNAAYGDNKTLITGSSVLSDIKNGGSIRVN